MTFVNPLISPIYKVHKSMKTFDRISIDPQICNGKPVIRGKRITVQTILGYMAEGDSKETILEQYPTLESEDIDAVLKFAAAMMDAKYEIKQIA